MKKLTDWLVKDLITEDIKLDVKVGDTVLMGRFKNKRVVVKSIDFNEKGDMMINGRSALKFRMTKPTKKLLPVKRPSKKDSVAPDADMRGVNESKDLKLNIPSDIKKIHKLFKKDGKKLFVVGGAVRDAILGKSPKDFDLATDAKPDEIKKIAEKGKLSTSGTVGEKFGVVVVGGHEIATFRKDIGKGRRPDAVDYTDIEGDVKRRDLTINALFYDMDRSEIVDLVGGIEDLQNKKIRTVGNASDRFDEDPLRKMRALRFHGALGGKMSKDTKQALKDDPSLKGVSGERIRDEFVKSIKKAKSTKNYLQKTDEFEFTKLILPGITVSKPYIDENDHILFLAWILRKNDASSLGGKLNKLKYSRDEAQNIQFLNTLQSFKPEKIFLTKKFQERTSLTDDQIIQWGKYIGKDLKKMVNFKLSVKGSDVSKDIKGKDIGNAIQKMEKDKFLNEIDVPSPSRAGVKKNKTDKMSGYKKVNEKIEKTLDSYMKNVVYSIMENDKIAVEECVTIGQKIGNDVILGKNRDRNYSPNIMMVRELLNSETEACYLIDNDTDWCEGINSHGIGIVNSALFVKRDEKDFDKAKKTKAPSKDGNRIRQALSYNNLKDVVRSLVNFEKGIKGHTTVSDGKKIVVIENTSRTKPTVQIHDLNVPVVRSNHGIKHPEQGYTRGPDRVSSQTRMKYAIDLIKTIKDYKKLFPALYNHTQKLGPKFDVVRSQNKLWTSSQLLYNLNKLKVMLYLIPGKVHFKGIVNKLPDGYKSKINLEIRQYEHSPDDKYDTFVTTDKVKKPTILDKKVDVEERKIQEEKEITRVIGIYGGRFQPFGPHHLKTYQWLQGKVDEVYITTSDIKKPPKHPMNYAEKVRHMVKMGIPANKIIKEKTPYVAKNTLSKFDPETTAVVYIFGKKDGGRLTGGMKKSGGKTYYQNYDKNNLVGFEKHGFIMTAPHTSMNIAGMEISGTTMRKVLGSPKIKDEDRPKVFKKLFGYYDKGVYNMMTNKFKKLFEFIENVKPLLKEVSALGHHFNGSSITDEGFYDFFRTFDDYTRVSPKHAEILGWSVLGDIINRDRAISPRLDLTFQRLDTAGGDTAVDSVTFGKTVNQTTRNTSSVSDPFPAHEKHMRNIIKKMGWEVVKFMGQKTVDIEDSELADMMNILSKTAREKVLKEHKRELLLMGGAYGHMSHPFDDNDLTFADLKNIITLGLGGKLDREDGVTEKLDGQNLMISWVDGELKAARNKGHLKNKGATAPNTDGVKSIFAGRGNVEKAFVSAMTDLSRAVKGLSDAQKEKIFGNGSKWMNLEIMFPATANVVDYDVAEIIFHGTIEYDDSGSPIGQPKDSARMLAGMIKQANANVQKTFKIGKPNFLTVPKTQDFGKKKSKFLGKLKTIQGHYALKDTSRLGEYHQAFWQEYVFNASKQFGVKLKNNQFVQLVNRWAYFDKSYKVPMIKKDYADKPKFLDWILSTDKNDHSKIFKDNIKPIETLFFEVGAEILKNIVGYMAASPDKTIQKMRKEVESALKDLKSGGNPEKLKKLKLQIEKLEAIGGVNAIVPSEGIVFKYKGKVYKFTGAFAPINQILGSLKFG